MTDVLTVSVLSAAGLAGGEISVVYTGEASFTGTAIGAVREGNAVFPILTSFINSYY